MIKKVIGSYLINLFAFYEVSQIISGFNPPSDLKNYLVVVAAFSLIHLLIKPILNFFLKALNFLTLGLIGLAVDVGLLYALTIYFPQISISGWVFPGATLSGIMVTSRAFNQLETLAISAVLLNLIRSALSAIFD